MDMVNVKHLELFYNVTFIHEEDAVIDILDIWNLGFEGCCPSCIIIIPWSSVLCIGSMGISHLIESVGDCTIIIL